LEKVHLTFRKVKDNSPTPIDYKTIELDYRLLQERPKKCSKTILWLVGPINKMQVTLKPLGKGEFDL
jgi:hypothetical protein